MGLLNKPLQWWAYLPLLEAYALGNEEQDNLLLPETKVLGNKELINREESSKNEGEQRGASGGI